MVLLYEVGKVTNIPCTFGHGDSIEYMVFKEREEKYLIQVTKKSDLVGRPVYYHTILNNISDDKLELISVVAQKYLEEIYSKINYKEYLSFMQANYRGELYLLEEELFLALDKKIIEKGVWHPTITGVYLYNVLGAHAMKMILEEDCDTSNLSSLIMGMLQKVGEPSMDRVLNPDKRLGAGIVRLNTSSIFNSKSKSDSADSQSKITEYPLEGIKVNNSLNKSNCFDLTKEGAVVGTIECISFFEDHIIIDLSSKGIYEKVLGIYENKNLKCISKMDVEYTHRNKGIGETFLKEVLKRMKNQGIDVVVLQAYPTDGGTINELIRFYRRCGFKIIHDGPTETNISNRMVLMAVELV